MVFESCIPKHYANSFEQHYIWVAKFSRCEHISSISEANEYGFRYMCLCNVHLYYVCADVLQHRTISHAHIHTHIYTIDIYVRFLDTHTNSHEKLLNSLCFRHFKSTTARVAVTTFRHKKSSIISEREKKSRSIFFCSPSIDSNIIWIESSVAWKTF